MAAVAVDSEAEDRRVDSCPAISGDAAGAVSAGILIDID